MGGELVSLTISGCPRRHRRVPTVAASRGGVHIADFPSTWDELTIELQCVAHDAHLPSLAEPARCAGHDFFLAPKNEAPHLPFSPRENKRLFFETIASYCGVF